MTVSPLAGPVGDPTAPSLTAPAAFRLVDAHRHVDGIRALDGVDLVIEPPAGCGRPSAASARSANAPTVAAALDEVGLGWAVHERTSGSPAASGSASPSPCPSGRRPPRCLPRSSTTPPGHPLSALRASGARSAPALAYGLLPAAAPLLLSYAFYRFECPIRSVVVLGVVGVGGLGNELVLSLRSRNWDEVWTLVAAVVVLSAAVDLCSSRLRGDLAVTTCSDWSAGSAQGGDGGTRGRTARARWTVLVAVGGVSATLDTLSMAILAMALAVVVTLLLGPLATRVRRPLVRVHPPALRRRSDASPGSWPAPPCSSCARSLRPSGP